MNNKTYLECECQSPEHRLVFTFEEHEQIHKYDEPELYASILLNNGSFWHRLNRSVKYLFGYKCKYGDFDEFILDYKDLPKFKKMLNEYEKHYKKFLDGLK